MITMLRAQWQVFHSGGARMGLTMGLSRSARSRSPYSSVQDELVAASDGATPTHGGFRMTRVSLRHAER